jgi:hypothetical protein
MCFFSTSICLHYKDLDFSRSLYKNEKKNSSNNNNGNDGIGLFRARFWSCVIFFLLFIFFGTQQLIQF